MSDGFQKLTNIADNMRNRAYSQGLDNVTAMYPHPDSQKYHQSRNRARNRIRQGLSILETLKDEDGIRAAMVEAHDTLARLK